MAEVGRSSVSGLRTNKRYICTHDSSGKSVYADSPAQAYYMSGDFGSGAHSFAVSSVPANLAEDADISAYRDEEGASSYRSREIVNSDGGANLLVVDIHPGAKSAMHRTVSIDFSICVEGEIEHELDNGEKVKLFPGDHIVQRGTNHRWHNASTTKPARLIAVTLASVPFKVAGEEIKEVHISSDEWDKSHSKA